MPGTHTSADSRRPAGTYLCKVSRGTLVLRTRRLHFPILQYMRLQHYAFMKPLRADTPNDVDIAILRWGAPGRLEHPETYSPSLHRSLGRPPRHNEFALNRSSCIVRQQNRLAFVRNSLLHVVVGGQLHHVSVLSRCALRVVGILSVDHCSSTQARHMCVFISMPSHSL